MIRNNNEGQMEAQETISQIEKKIAEYEERIASKQQRESFNPFNIIEERIFTQNMSRQDRFKKFMEEAKQAILQKLGPDVDMKEASKDDGSRISSHEDSAMFQDSQDPYDLENDNDMAEFYAKLYPEGHKSKVSSDTESSDKTEDKTDSKKKKKGKSKRK